MARLIDADALKAKANADPDSGEGFVWVQDIDEATTVDAVPVVRCKDCFWWHDFETHMDCRNPFGIDLPMPDDFCSCGERRTDG